MPKAKGFKDLRHMLEVRDANKLPREGFFSTLDELIAAAPQDRMTTKQWREYLAPGRTLEREGIMFPLKKEELEYSLPGYVQKSDPVAYPGADERFLTKGDLQNMTRRIRPEFRSHGMSSIAGGQFNSYSTKGPYRKEYFEAQTESPDFGKFDTHFSPETLSWSRGSRHEMENEPGGGVLRLIDEIQSDRHSAAAEKVKRDPLTGQAIPFDADDVPDHTSEEAIERMMDAPITRRGYRTPEDEQLIEDHSDMSRGELRLLRQEDPEGYEDFRRAQVTPPDAPFKSAADYGRLELKRGMLSAIEQGDRYLGVTPSEGPIGWFRSGEDQIPGMKHAYDSVYPGELKKLARMYGAPMRDLDLPVEQRGSRTIPILDEDDIDFPDFIDGVEDIMDGVPAGDRGTYPRVVMQQMRNATDNPHVAAILDGADLHLNRYLEKHAAAESHNTAENATVAEAEYAKAEQALQQWQRSMHEANRLWGRTMSGQDVGTRKVPSMELTPEVVEKIKKAGIPIWAVTSGIVGLDALSGDHTEGPAFKTGGAVVPFGKAKNKDDALASIDSLATYLGTPDKAGRRRHAAAGMLSQIMGVNAQGDTTFMGNDPDSVVNSGTGELSFPTIRPGLWDETIGTLNMFGNGPKFSKDATDRTERLDEDINERMGLEQPKGFGENFARSLGVMAGQVPVPARRIKEGVQIAGSGLKKFGQLAKKYGTGAQEFFSPVVEPGVGTYASGALFGGTLGTLPEWMEDFLSSHPEVVERMRKGNAIPEGYGDRQREVGYAVGGEVGMTDPRRGMLAQMGGEGRQYIGTPKTEEQLAHYGEGPEASYFANNKGPAFNVDWNAKDPTGGGGSTATVGGGNNALIGVLGSLPQIWKGVGMADKALGTDMQGTVKGWGSDAYNYGKEALGLGSTVAGAIPGTIGATSLWGGSAGAGTIGSLGGEGYAAMNAASPLGQATLNLGTTGAGTGTAAAAGTGAAATTAGTMSMASSAMAAAPVMMAAYAAMPYFNKLVGNDTSYSLTDQALTSQDDEYAGEGYGTRVTAQDNPLSALFSKDKGLALGYNGTKFTDMNGKVWDQGTTDKGGPANAKKTYLALQKQGAALPSLDEFTKYWTQMNTTGKRD